MSQFEFCKKKRVLSQFEFCHKLSFVTSWVFEFITIRVFFLIMSQHEFWSWITFWVFKFNHNLSFWVSSEFEFLSVIPIWVFEFHQNLSFWVFCEIFLVVNKVCKKQFKTNFVLKKVILVTTVTTVTTVRIWVLSHLSFWFFSRNLIFF